MAKSFSPLDVNKMIDEQPLLAHSMRTGNIELVKLILNSPNLKNINETFWGEPWGEFEWNFLGYAVYYDLPEICDIILQRDDVDIDREVFYEYTPFQLAVEKGRLDVVNVFLKYSHKYNLNFDATFYVNILLKKIK
eukprot:TRINITY_DN1435_c0_g1_i5.p1 TRINITY_DN1435_c0_g1~~TRINITY_DN1435_c0_g1_i5.p1  ORF type:complete len:136 (-),score=24.45 TRINITY_DN1435_c0_g1_i5:77-484(-)